MAEESLTLTVEETARLLRIGRATCYQQIREGIIPSVRFGRVIRVPRSALERMLVAGGQGLGLNLGRDSK